MREQILEMSAGRELDDPLKYCRGCGKNQPIYQFTKNKRSPDGRDWRCKSCKAGLLKKYIHSDKGKETRRRYYERTKTRWMELKREKRTIYAKDNPEKVRARQLIGNAVRRGYIPKPEDSRDWYNRWEFHHPDYSRPYYGVWLLTPDHRNVEYGNMECPACTDYSDVVRKNLLKDWGLAVMEE